ncbi:MAG: hypothetical protein KF781_03665 [Chitinophagaceae bacterium]|nr:hypothetical protein [Chitinophagaceae bacterium]MCW5904819.1 hypothetical protein [Chitinophagaceae bacterium]
MKVKGIESMTVIEVNDTYILGVYQGSLSKYDLLLRYRQKDTSSKSGWSRIRTPKHIHWAVDAIIKMHHNNKETKKFLSFLIDLWNKHIFPLKTEKERDLLLDVDKLKNEANTEAKKYPKLADKGEYSIKFLYLIAKLLMVQEKINLSTAYMFKNLLESLKSHKDIYKIVSIATHNRR